MFCVETRRGGTWEWERTSKWYNRTWTTNQGWTSLISKCFKRRLGVGNIKFKAYIGTLFVTVLTDEESSDNFLQPRVAKFLKLSVVQAPRFRVMVGNGNYMELEGLI